jgi:hypothetical protein
MANLIIRKMRNAKCEIIGGTPAERATFKRIYEQRKVKQMIEKKRIN